MPRRRALETIMRLLLSTITLLALTLFGSAAESISGEGAISQLLAKPKSWTMYIEYTDAPTPSDRAQRMSWRYFIRDGRILGQQLGLAFGGCDFEVKLRKDGFSFPWCPPYNGEPSLDFDPNDPLYPFKSRNPRKIWLTPDK